MNMSSFSFRPVAARLLLTGAMLGLGGCASMAPSSHSTAEAQAERPYHAAIDISGRLSVRYQQQGSEQALHGSFDWQQTSRATRVTLRSPLGQIVAVIAVTPEGATLTKAGEVTHRAADVDALTAQVLGWPLPVAHLQDWLQGFVRDDRGELCAVPIDGEQRVQTADGWQLHYAGWQTDAAQTHPKRIDLERHTRQAGQVALRIVLDNWQPQE